MARTVLTLSHSLTFHTDLGSYYSDPDVLRLNICGQRFEIRRSTAARYTDSLFGILASETREGRQELLRSKGIFQRTCPDDVPEWYAERSVNAFGLILDYMCTGRLHCPESVCKELLKSELAFWRLYDVPLPDCCWDDEDEDVDVQKELKYQEQHEMRKRRSAPRHSQQATFCNGKYAKKIKRVLTGVVGKPVSSRSATVFSGLSIFFICLAIVNLIISTLPSLQTCRDPGESQNDNGSESDYDPGNSTRRTKVLGLKYREDCEGSLIFEVIEAICVSWFTFEFLLRFACAHSKRAFLRSFLNVIDLLAIIPFYIDIVVWLIDVKISQRHHWVQSLLQILRMFRVFRLFSIVRLARYSESLKLMGASLWQSRREFGVLVVFIGFTITIFSSIVFYCEKDLPDTDFTSIPATFWWAVVTVTTVGYGDMTPKSIAGKAFSAVCCVTGIVIVAFPVSILVEHFHRLYRSRAKKAPLHRIAIMATPGEIAVVQMRKPTRIAKVSPYEMTCKL